MTSPGGFLFFVLRFWLLWPAPADGARRPTVVTLWLGPAKVELDRLSTGTISRGRGA